MIYLAIFIYLQIGFGFAVAIAANSAEAGKGTLKWWEWPLLVLIWPFFVAAFITEVIDD